MATMDQAGCSFIRTIRIAVWLTSEAPKVGRQLDSLLWFISVGLTSVLISTPPEYTRGSLGQMGERGLLTHYGHGGAEKIREGFSPSKLLSALWEACWLTLRSEYLMYNIITGTLHNDDAADQSVRGFSSRCGLLVGVRGEGRVIHPASWSRPRLYHILQLCLWCEVIGDIIPHTAHSHRTLCAWQQLNC